MSIITKFSILVLLLTLVGSSADIFAQSFDNTPAQSRSKRNKVTQNLNTPMVGSTVDQQQRAAYDALLIKKSHLEQQIDNTTSLMNSSKTSKAKKYHKELIALQSEYDAVLRTIGTYPQSMANPSIKQEQDDKVAAEFRRQLEQKMDEKVAQVEGNDALLLEGESDPEIREAYEKYLNPELETAKETPSEDGVFFTVQIASGKSGQASSFKLSEPVAERRAGNSPVYTVGRFFSIDDANHICQNIRSSTRYRDAFVVAFSGTKRISVAEAKSLLK